MTPRTPRITVVALLVATTLFACSSDDGDQSATVAAATTTAIASSDPTTTPTDPTTTPPATTLPATSAEPTTTEVATTLATTTTASTTSTSTTEAPPQLTPAEAAMAYTEPGPYPVGVTTLALPSGNVVEVWYPAPEGTATGPIEYDVRDFVPESISAVLTADIPATYSFDGARDAEVADGEFPLVVFSHGFTGFRLQSTFLTSHLASWGLVVVAPDHPARDMMHVLDGSAANVTSDPVDELLATVDLMHAENEVATSRFTGRIAPDTAVALGHSAGGGTIVGAALDDRISGYVSMASGVREDTALPDRPSFFLAGALDSVANPDFTVSSYETVTTPTRLWVIDGVGHNGFDDLCTLGGGSGIIGVAEASGLGVFLDSQPQLRALGEDGCLPPAVPVETTFPLIRHAVTAWILNHVGVDPHAVGLGPEVADQYVVPVRTEERAG